jgi:hypothetical protein
MGTPSEEFSLILDLDFTRAAIESFDLAGHGSRRESGICVEAQRKDGVRDLLKRRVERLSLRMFQSGSSGTVLAETGFAVQSVIWRNSQPNRSVSIGRDFGIK